LSTRLLFVYEQPKAGGRGMRKVGDRIRENQRGHTIPFDGGADGTPA
jgi:hypothetical protein